MEKAYTYKKVMIVDDNEMDRVLSNKVIENCSFADQVVSFGSVYGALAYLISIVDVPVEFPDVIFLDINMPIKDGFDFLDIYVKFPDEAQKRCTIVMISSTNSEEDFMRINTYPVVRMFFSKPLTETILNEVRKVMKAGSCSYRRLPTH